MFKGVISYQNCRFLVSRSLSNPVPDALLYNINLIALFCLFKLLRLTRERERERERESNESDGVMCA